MGKPRSGNKQQGLVMHYGRSKLVVTVELIITLIGWLYLLFTLILAGSALFNWNIEWVQVIFIVLQVEKSDVKSLFIKLALIAPCLFILQYLWGKYNYAVYGKLQRRKFPEQVQVKELAEHFQVTEEEIRYFQENDIIKLRERFF